MKSFLENIFQNGNLNIKNAYVITGMIQGKECIAENRVGRVAQVRLEAGDYGSDCVLLRHKDDSLVPHENQSFYLFLKSLKNILMNLSKMFMKMILINIFTLAKEKRKKRFIIPSKIKKAKDTNERY